MIFKSEGYAVVCAYCQKVKTQVGTYIPISELEIEEFKEFKAKNRKLRVSHGICPECLVDARKKAKLEIEKMGAVTTHVCLECRGKTIENQKGRWED